MRAASGSSDDGSSIDLCPTRRTQMSRTWSRLSLSVARAIEIACSSDIVPGEILRFLIGPETGTTVTTQSEPSGMNTAIAFPN